MVDDTCPTNKEELLEWTKQLSINEVENNRFFFATYFLFEKISKEMKLGYIGKRDDGISVFGIVDGRGFSYAILCIDRDIDPDEYDVVIFTRILSSYKDNNGHVHMKHMVDYSIRRKDIMKW